MRISLIAGAVLVLAACSQQAQSAGTGETASVRGCHAVATQGWQAGAEALTIEAISSGPDCVRAVATLVVRNSDGEVWWTDARAAEDVMTLAGAESVEDMQRRLSEWIGAPGAARDSTADLPVWPAGADAPDAGEFPFYVEEGFDRTGYEGMRAADRAMFCYVQGMESLACVAAVDGRLDKIGVQTFPG